MFGKNPRVNIFLEKIKTTKPIIQAPMAGATKTKLAAEVSNLGGLGSLGVGYLSAAQVREEINSIRQLTNKPFAINLFIPPYSVSSDNQQKINRMKTILKKYEDELKIPLEHYLSIDPTAQFLEQIEVIIEEKVPIFSFTFGIPSEFIMNRLKENGTIIMGTATTVNEAIHLEQAGCDVVIAQGIEAGGHRGSFLSSIDQSLIGSMALIPQVVDSVGIPVIAAGGIMDGRGIIASLALGASGVQMGTAFLTCDESEIHPLYRKALLEGNEQSTILTNVYSGKFVRGIYNRFMKDLANHGNDIPDYPYQHFLTQPIRKAATKQNNNELMAMWGGQGMRLNRECSARELFVRLEKECNEILQLFTN